MNPPGRIVRNLVYRLRLHFPTLELESGDGTARSGVAWCDKNDHSQVFPIPCAYMQCFGAIAHTPSGPRFGFAADTVDAIAWNAPWPPLVGARLDLYDAHGAVLGHFMLAAPWDAMDLPIAGTFGWEEGYDPKKNPLGYAAGIEYVLRSSGNGDVRFTKTLDDPTELILAAKAQSHVVLEGPADLSLSSMWTFFGFTGTGGTADLSLLWQPGVYVGAILSGLRDGVPPFPPRNYTRWRFELVSPNPPAPYNIKLVFAEGPITNDQLQAPDQHEAEFVYTPGNPPSVLFNNPAVAGWTGRLHYRIVVW